MGGFNPSASTLTQCASPGICPVTRTKTGMGSGSSGSKLCLSRVDATPLPPSPFCRAALQLSSVFEMKAGNVNELVARQKPAF